MMNELNLLRHTTGIHTCPAEASCLLYERNLLPVARRSTGSSYTSTATTDHDKIVIILSMFYPG